MVDIVLDMPLGKKSAGDDKLLLELLKESRELLLCRVGSQRRRIVELTAQYNELLAEVNGVGASGDDVASLKAHLADMEENARKLAKELEESRHVCVVRSEEMEQLVKSVEKVAKERDGVREELRKAVGDIADLTAELAKVKEELRGKKLHLVSNTGKMNTYKMMVDYARAMGVQFPRMGVMKQVIVGCDGSVADNYASGVETPSDEEKGLLAEVLDQMQERYEEYKKDEMNGEDYSDAVAMDKQDCPWGVEQSKNKVAIVGGRYCRKSCPWNDGINEDENFVHCSKGK